MKFSYRHCGEAAAGHGQRIRKAEEKSVDFVRNAANRRNSAGFPEVFLSFALLSCIKPFSGRPC
jgi:hypothetical protein